MKRTFIAIALALASATAAATPAISAEYNRLNSLFWKGGCTGTLYMHEGGGDVKNRPCWGSLKVWVTSDDVDLSHGFFYNENDGYYEIDGPNGFSWGTGAKLDILFSFPQDNVWWNGTQTAWVSGDGQSGHVAMLNNGNGFNIYEPDDINRYNNTNYSFDWALGSEQFGTFFWFGNFTSSQYIDNGFHSGVHVPGAVQMPEPGSLALLGLGAIGLAAVRSKRRERAAA